jgi:hypothetical protein
MFSSDFAKIRLILSVSLNSGGIIKNHLTGKSPRERAGVINAKFEVDFDELFFDRLRGVVFILQSLNL